MSTSSLPFSSVPFSSGVFNPSIEIGEMVRQQYAVAELPEYTLTEDVLYVLSLTYQMLKASLMGFAMFGIPFWIVTIGFLSILH